MASGGNIVGDRAELLTALTDLRPELVKRFSVKRIGVFGSMARDEHEAASDVDIVVDLAEPTFDHYMDLKFFLEEVLGREVDLLMADAVKPRLKPTTLQETVYV